MFQLARAHLVERYVVPSASMEPTLHGDPVDGDRVLVDRTARHWWQPEPWDLVVLDDPAGGDHLVKRVVAVATADSDVAVVAIRHGDVFVGPDPGRLRRVRKDPERAREMRVSSFVFDGSQSGADLHEFVRADPERWRLDGAAILLQGSDDPLARTQAGPRARRFAATPPDPFLPGHLSSAQPLDTGFLDCRGVLRSRYRGFPRDLGLEIEVSLGSGARAVHLVFEERETYYSLLWGSDGSGRFAVDGEDAAPGMALPALTSGPVTVAFGYVDGEFFAEHESRRVWSHRLELPEEPRVAIRGERTRLANLLHVGVAGGTATITRLRLFHDVHFASDNVPHYRLAAGELFVLGDNTFDSEDSRVRVLEPFRLDDVVGRPLAVIGPWGRARSLVRHP